MENANVSHGGSQPPASNNSQIEFVNLFGTPKHTKEKAKTVRSHVMKLVRKKQHESLSRSRCLPLLPLSKKTITNNRSISAKGNSLQKLGSRSEHDYLDDATRSPPKLSLITRWVESTGVYGSLQELDNPVEVSIPQLPTGSSDSWKTQESSKPVSTSPDSFTPGLHDLFHFAAQNSVPGSVYENTTNEFSRGVDTNTVNSNTGLLNITLSWASAYVAQGNKAGDLESAMCLEKALNSINCALANASIDVEDSTIAAVATLCNMENLNGDIKKALIHFRGLQSLVSMKGGVEALGLSGTLRRLVLWVDLCHATCSQSIPTFPSVSFSELPPLSSYMPTAAPDSLLYLYDPIITTSILSGYSDLLPLLQALHELSLFLDFMNPKDNSVLHNVAYVDHIYLAEHKNLMLMAQYQEAPPTALTMSLNIKETQILPFLFQSLMIYIYTNIRLTPRGGSIRSTLVCRLQTTVSKMPVPMLDVLFETFPHEIFWIMFVAGASSVEDIQRQYFIAHLEWMCKRLALVYWQDVENYLRHFLWLHTQFLESCKNLWTEVALYTPNDNDWN